MTSVKTVLTVALGLAALAPAAALAQARMAPPAGAVGCTTGDAGVSWTMGETAAASEGRVAQAAAAPSAQICASAQAALLRINGSDAARNALAAAVDANDAAALKALLLANGLSPDFGGAQFHAINTKGTGGVNGRVAAPASGVTVGVGYDARTKRGYSLANWMYFNAKSGRRPRAI